MEEREDHIDNLLDTEYSKYNHYKDKVLSILGIDSKKNKLHPSMNTTIEELKRLWGDGMIDDDNSPIYSTDSIEGSDETPQPKAITNAKPLTIEGLHKIEGSYKWGVITDTLHNGDRYIIEMHPHHKPNDTFEATIYRELVEDSKVRIDIKVEGGVSVRYHTYKEGFRNKKDFVMELFALLDDYQYGK